MCPLLEATAAVGDEFSGGVGRDAVGDGFGGGVGRDATAHPPDPLPSLVAGGDDVAVWHGDGVCACPAWVSAIIRPKASPTHGRGFMAPLSLMALLERTSIACASMTGSRHMPIIS